VPGRGPFKKAQAWPSPRYDGPARPEFWDYKGILLLQITYETWRVQRIVLWREAFPAVAHGHACKGGVHET
jgi:hypothetical protein